MDICWLKNEGCYLYHRPNFVNNPIKYVCFLCFEGSPLNKCFVNNTGSDRPLLVKLSVFHKTLNKHIKIFLFIVHENILVLSYGRTKHLLFTSFNLFSYSELSKYLLPIREGSLSSKVGHNRIWLLKECFASLDRVILYR